MPTVTKAEVESQVISIIRNISGAKNITLDQMVSRDIGIYGLDGTELVEELETTFEVDLDPLIRSHSFHLPLRWFDRLLGRENGPMRADATVQELIDYIAAAPTRG